jgi:4,5-dihydroxyphthalate decarboxylase
MDIRLTAGSHDCLGPLARGEVVGRGLQVSLDHRTAIDRTFDGDPLPASEASLSRYLMMRANGDDRYCGLPFFMYRGFRHRFFFVRHDSHLHALPDLRGLRVGITAWFETGNTWTKALLHDAGLAVDNLEWVLGPLDEHSMLKPQRPGEPSLPPYVNTMAPGSTLIGDLRAGRLDAVVAAFPPTQLGQQAGVRRLFANYREAEHDYFRRTSIYPAGHIVVVDRRLVVGNPGLLLGIFGALTESWDAWIARGFLYADAAPWVLPALEEGIEVLGPGWQQHGLETAANQRMLQVLADEQLRQGHISRPADPLAAFEDYSAALAAE